MSILSGEPPIGGALSVIRSLLPAPAPSEQRVAAQFLEYPADATASQDWVPAYFAAAAQR